MSREKALDLAAEALDWIAQERDRLGAFLASTGAAPADIASGAGDETLLAGVLDFLMADETRVVAFCDERGHDRTAPARAQAVLAGAGATHWT